MEITERTNDNADNVEAHGRFFSCVREISQGSSNQQGNPARVTNIKVFSSEILNIMQVAEIINGIRKSLKNVKIIESNWSLNPFRGNADKNIPIKREDIVGTVSAIFDTVFSIGRSSWKLQK